ncbi:MAG: ribonuclease R [Cycloclasticus sp. symbiont of Poecilosclerida sp. M]|nr:MAG: ribonuclease R [Cycloclasticus sp. symbiont of Poecilosclerida sp. M]
MSKNKKPKITKNDDAGETQDGVSLEKSTVLDFLVEQKTPQNWPNLVDGLGLRSKKSHKKLTRILKGFESAGQIIVNRKGQYCVTDQAGLITGTIIGHANGFGFLKRDGGGDDLFLPPKQMRLAMDGDRVVASEGGVNRQGKVEGRIVEILERKVCTVVGRFFEKMGSFHVEPENKRINHNVFIPAELTQGAKQGQIVLAEITHYPNIRMQTIGKVVEIMGDHMAPGMEIDVAIRAHDLPHQWSQVVLSEAQGFSVDVLAQDVEGRKDLRKLPLVTIDGADAKDFDDAVYCKPDSKGWTLYVAIADVAHYVRPSSALDTEAIERGTSVYFPGQVLPMLPEVLSNGLCSLKPKVDRLCMVCEVHIDPQGQLSNAQFYEAVMHSHARLLYDEVGGILDGSDQQAKQKHAALIPHLKNLHDLYAVLKKASVNRGALDFDTVETQFEFDEERKIKAITPVVRHDAHKLIEVCMIAVNSAAARFLIERKIPLLLRVHEGPGIEKLLKLREFLSELGLSLEGGEEPKPAHYKALMEKVKDRPDSHLIQMAVLRSMSQAIYSPEEEGHFGLAIDRYAHFTSPIRRYPDLLVHRGLKHAIKGSSAKKFSYSAGDMAELGEHCSYNERRADEATRDVTSWLKCEFMLDKVGQEFKGVVSSVTSFGLFVELEGTYVEGLVHVTALGDDYYQYDAAQHRLLGERSRRSFRMGDELSVELISVNLDEKKIDLALTGASTQKPSRKKRTKHSKSKRR